MKYSIIVCVLLMAFNVLGAPQEEAATPQINCGRNYYQYCECRHRPGYD
jgi:hypothetical protein